MRHSILLSLTVFFVFAGLYAIIAQSPFTEAQVGINTYQLENPSSDDSTVSDTNANATSSGKFPIKGVVSVSTRLRLRQWPWGPVISLHPGGTNITITGEDGEFYQVECGGVKGYMHKNYVSIPGAPASQIDPYYPGDTRAGGYIPQGANPADFANPYDSAPVSASAQEAEKALANYKGGKLSPDAFIRLFGPIARESQKNTGIPASVVLAQAALETGWGASSIKDAKNLFGIKGTGPAGTVRVSTKEYRNGAMRTEMANFRKYNTWMESIQDHGKLLQNKRYAKAMNYKNNPDQFAREIHKAGYATDPQYANKLINLMKTYNLYRYNL